MNYLLIALLHLVNPNAINTSESLSHDIILVQGEAKLVTMTPSGEIVQSYSILEDYFSSSASHEDIVNRAIAKTSDLINTRFITVDYDADGLSEGAIEHIRYIAVLAEQSPRANIQITLTNDEHAQSITDDLYNIIEGFGIDQNRIQITSKKYLGKDENQFIKISITPNGNS